VVQYGIDHFMNDDARLIRVHLQQIRRCWSGPEDKINPASKYQQHILQVDDLLAKLIQTFKKEGIWESTFIIAASDHGMGSSEKNNHFPSDSSSWLVFMNFYGPGIKKGISIPYAETPDLAIMINYFLNLRPLQGHLDPAVVSELKGATGTFLKNILEGNPTELEHPKFIRRYLESKKWKPSNNYEEYRLAMISYIKEIVLKK
jgi:hypothetical protein